MHRTEIIEARQKQIAENILRNLSHSRAHAHMSPFERMALADKMAVEALADRSGFEDGAAPATAWDPGSEEFNAALFTEVIP